MHKYFIVRPVRVVLRYHPLHELRHRILISAPLLPFPQHHINSIYLLFTK